MADDTESVRPALSADPRYRVLARKYRPTTFDALIGQDALVQTLSNAFRAGRVAHAYMLSGVRGVGKTTTARIIARALNCTGADGQGGITISPCGVCDHCVAIAEDRHLDIIEMDAASHTGVDNIRELLDGVPYRPALARYKVYIIDEVHMLSEKAFNALLKTLEEPPEHVKFVFATTEIRKVPVTVLSRCQRFDLRRVDAAMLSMHLSRVAEQEKVAVTPGARQLLARAADGSVRDALSLLDRAIAHASGEVAEDTVREMLGLVDRGLSFDLLDALLRGDAAAALKLLDQQYRSGADPLIVLEDLLELVHWLTRLKLSPELAAAADVPEAERVRGKHMAENLEMADVTRAWQILLKGLAETRTAPMPLHAAEMVLIRLAYAAQLPSPAEALQALVGSDSSAPRGEPPPARGVPGAATSAGSSPGRAAGSAGGSSGVASTAEVEPRSFSPRAAPEDASTPSAAPGPRGALAQRAQAAPAVITAPPDHLPPDHLPPGRTSETAEATHPEPRNFAELVQLARVNQEGMLYAHLCADVHLVRFEPRSIELRLGRHAPPDLPHRLSRFINDATGARWLVGVSQEAGEPSLREQQEARAAAQLAEAERHPLVQAIFATFPGAVLDRVVEVPAGPDGEDPPGASESEAGDDADE